jgi:signal peptidase I
MVRRTIKIAVTALALVALSASSAAAEVEVANPGEMTIEADFAMQQINQQYPSHFCDDSTFEGTVASDGYVELIDIDFASSESVHSSQRCDSPWPSMDLNDCDDLGVIGQIYGPGDTLYDQVTIVYGQVGDFIVFLDDWCVDIYGEWNWGTQDVGWGITGTGGSQVWTYITPQGAWDPGYKIATGATLESSSSFEITSLN